MNEEEIRIIENNLQLRNREIAELLNKSEQQVRYFLYKNGVKRTPEQREQLALRIGATQKGENNGNWKGGRSTNNYYYKLRQVERHPERVRARELVYKAKKSGKLIPEPCLDCGSMNVQAHHPDHSKPLDVIWVCPKHHRIMENENSLFSGKI